MKKLFLLLFSTGLIVTSLYADLVSETKAMLEPVCSQFDLAIFTDKRYQDSGTGADVARSYFDTKTIQIDKKNKTVDVWVSYIQNASGRKKWIDAAGNKYADLGFIAQLKRIFYTKNKMTFTAATLYNCDGSIIESKSNVNYPVSDMTPASMDEILTKDVMKKYSLK